MRYSLIFLAIYILILIVAIVFLSKFTNRGYSRRLLSDISACPFGKSAYYPVQTINENKNCEGIFSFSLYGNYKKYSPSLYKQLDDIPKYFPAYQAWIYAPIDLPKEVEDELLSRNACIIKMNGGDSLEQARKKNAKKVGIKGHEAATWRFLAAMQTKPFVCLDADDKFPPSLVGKIRNWLRSGKPFFSFKETQAFIPLGAGRWGARAINGEAPIPDMLDRLNRYCDTWFGFDEAFLKKEIWPIFKEKGYYRSIYFPDDKLLVLFLIVLFVAGAYILIKTIRNEAVRDS
jgi:hypothetical protein